MNCLIYSRIDLAIVLSGAPTQIKCDINLEVNRSSHLVNCRGVAAQLSRRGILLASQYNNTLMLWNVSLKT